METFSGLETFAPDGLGSASGRDPFPQERDRVFGEIDPPSMKGETRHERHPVILYGVSYVAQHGHQLTGFDFSRSGAARRSG